MRFKINATAPLAQAQLQNINYQLINNTLGQLHFKSTSRAEETVPQRCHSRRDSHIMQQSQNGT